MVLKPKTTMRIVRYSYPNSRLPALGSSFSRAPWSGLETEIDRLFESALGSFTGVPTSATRFPVDLFEDKDRTYVRAELPGVIREDVNVEIVDGYLTISATRKTPAQGEGQPEQSFSLSRSLELPEEVQADQISAAYENGILTVTLPKREETKPRKISVNVK
jgi:HSP20 family protein